MHPVVNACAQGRRHLWAVGAAFPHCDEAVMAELCFFTENYQVPTYLTRAPLGGGGRLNAPLQVYRG